jgi:phospholipase C
VEYHPVKYERPTYFQLSIAYVDINYCFANFKYAEGYVNIPYRVSMRAKLVTNSTRDVDKGHKCRARQGQWISGKKDKWI